MNVDDLQNSVGWNCHSLAQGGSHSLARRACIGWRWAEGDLACNEGVIGWSAIESAAVKVAPQQPKHHSKLFPRVIKPADVLQRLKQLLKAIDPHPRVVELDSMGGIPWKVTSL